MNLNHRITTAAVGIFILLLGVAPLGAQRRMSLSEAIGTARSQSVAALEAKHEGCYGGNAVSLRAACAKSNDLLNCADFEGNCP